MTQFTNHSHPLAGIVPPVITPLSGGQLDHQGLKRVIDHLIVGGVHALFILGTTGEAFHLSEKTQRDMVEQTCHFVAGRLPILVGIMDTNTQRSIELARHAASVGADAVVITPPLLLPVSQQSIIDYADEILASQPLPVFLYHNPALARTSFEPQTVAELSQRSRIVGFKDSSGDITYFRKVAELIKRPDFSLLIGAERLLPEALSSGGHGCVGGGAHIIPQTFVDLYNVLCNGQSTTVAPLYKRILTLGTMYGTSPTASSIIRRIKYALEIMGICRAEMASPLAPADPQEQQLVMRTLQELQILPNTGRAISSPALTAT